MEKRITLSNSEYLSSKEKRVTPFVLTKSGYEFDDRFSKTAASEEALEYASKLEPIPGYRIILVTGIGSTEYWGANKKADTFPINGLLGKHPSDVPQSHFDKYRNKIPKVWGISTFPTKFDSRGIQIGGGNTFQEHNNRVPPELMGKPVDYSNPKEPRGGYILKEFWNPKVYRVEIIQTVSEQKFPKWVYKIDNGEPVGVSMACDVGFDRCMNCGNLSTSLSNYCSCLRDRRTRGIIDINGRLYAMANDYPYFFDMTLTDRPADPVAAMLTKVAFDSDKIYYSENTWCFGNDYLIYSKQANIDVLESRNQSIADKIAIDDRDVNVLSADKQVQTPTFKSSLDEYKPRVHLPVFDSNQQPISIKPMNMKNMDYSHELANVVSNNLSSWRNSEEPFPLPVIKRLRNFPLSNLLSYLGLMSINPTNQDIANLLFDLPLGVSGLISRAVSSCRDFRLSSYDEPVFKVDIKININKSEPNIDEFKKVIYIVEPFLQRKSYSPEFVLSRGFSKTASEPAVDYSAVTDQLGQQAQAVLIARILSEPELLPKLSNFLNSPLVKKELLRAGIKFDATNAEILQGLLNSNTDKLYYNDRRKFFDKG